MRPELWSTLIKNPTNITKKWYEEYCKILDKRTRFGSRDIISKKIDACILEFMIDDDDNELKNSVMRNVLLFELSQPDIGFVIGMEKVALFFKRICNDYEAFIVFHNSIFSSSLLWSIYSQNHLDVSLKAAGKFIPELSLILTVLDENLLGNLQEALLADARIGQRVQI